MRKFRVGFVGVGKLGKDAAEVMHEAGHVVEGYDVSFVDTSISMRDTLEETVRNKDIVFIAVPTPHHPDYDGRAPTTHLPPRDFNYETAINVTAEVDSLVNRGTLVVLISTVLPGTVRAKIAPLIKNGRFVYNPYLIAQGTVKHDMRHPEMMMFGTETGERNKEIDTLVAFYDTIIEGEWRIMHGTWEEAEATKIFYNTFITAKLCLVNMIQDTAEAIGNMNVDVVTDALKDSTDRIMGPKYMKAGLGDGGGCHPRDNIALRWLADEYDFGYDLFDAIMEAREQQARNLAFSIICALHANANRSIGDDPHFTVKILGKGFKPGVLQDNGSPSMLVGHYLEHEWNCTVIYDDHGDASQDLEEKVEAYLIGWPDFFKDYNFAPNTVVVDPWRTLDENASNLQDAKLLHYGNTRKGAPGYFQP